MTLNEKFSALLPFYNVNDNNNKSIQCEKIADDYAIEFIRWYFDYVNEKDYYLKLLNEFKKEKGL